MRVVYFFLLPLILLLNPERSLAQNLVPNGGFDTYSVCPNAYNQIIRAYPWFRPTTGSSDFLHACSDTSIIDVPTNTFGYQQPRSGQGYAGEFIIWRPAADTAVKYREYMSTSLTTWLRADSCYHFEMFVNLASYSNHASDDIGVYFSDTIINGVTTSKPLPYIPQITNQSGQYITDTVGWTMVSGDYTAHGGESYIIIGNFKNNWATDVISVGSTSTSPDVNCYVLIDDISLVKIPNCLPYSIEEKTLASANIFPNPSNGTFQLTLSSGNGKENLNIYNNLGELIYSKRNLTESNTIDLSNQSPGIYFLRILNENQIISSQKIIKQ